MPRDFWTCKNLKEHIWININRIKILSAQIKNKVPDVSATLFLNVCIIIPVSPQGAISDDCLTYELKFKRLFISVDLKFHR